MCRLPTYSERLAIYFSESRHDAISEIAEQEDGGKESRVTKGGEGSLVDPLCSQNVESRKVAHIGPLLPERAR